MVMFRGNNGDLLNRGTNMNKDCNTISSINTNPVKSPRHGSMVSQPDFHLIAFCNFSFVEIMKKKVGRLMNYSL